MKNTASLLAAFLFLSSLCSAENQSPPQPGPRKAEWNFGLGVLSVNQPYVGLRSRIIPLPLVSYRGSRLQVDGIRASYSFFTSPTISAGPLVRIRFAGFDPDDSDFLRGMERRKDTMEAGVFTRIKLPKDFSISAAFAVDTLDHHNGHEFTTAVDKTFRKGKWGIAPSLEVKVQNSNLASYYFGVQAKEATTERPVYTVGSSANWTPGISTRYSFTPRIMGLFYANQEFLDTEIRNSPTVDRKSLSRFFAGLLFHF